LFFSADKDGDGTISLNEWRILHGKTLNLLQLTEEDESENEVEDDPAIDGEESEKTEE
jgi:hypothetical protein